MIIINSTDERYNHNLLDHGLISIKHIIDLVNQDNIDYLHNYSPEIIENTYKQIQNNFNLTINNETLPNWILIFANFVVINGYSNNGFEKFKNIEEYL